MSISQFMDHHFRHFNARETVDASRAWKKHLDDGGKMLLAMAGAMSTAELGISLAEMIRARQDPGHHLHRRPIWRKTSSIWWHTTTTSGCRTTVT